MDLETRQVTLERIRVEGGHAAMVLEKAGAVNLLRVLGRSNAGKLREKSQRPGKRRKLRDGPGPLPSAQWRRPG